MQRLSVNQLLVTQKLKVVSKFLLNCRKNTTETFDRQLKQRQKTWSYNIKESDYYDYLKLESASQIVDRIRDITRTLPKALELGSTSRSHILNELNQNLDNNDNKITSVAGIESLIQCDFGDISQNNNIINENIESIQTTKLIVDEEYLHFKSNSFDIIISSLSLHWVNNLPSTLNQIKGKLSFIHFRLISFIRQI